MRFPRLSFASFGLIERRSSEPRPEILHRIVPESRPMADIAFSR